jgi:hypothetical protein
MALLRLREGDYMKLQEGEGALKVARRVFEMSKEYKDEVRRGAGKGRGRQPSSRDASGWSAHVHAQLRSAGCPAHLLGLLLPAARRWRKPATSAG